MEFSQISIWLAFLAGLASFLSPCVFSLVPAYVGYLGGRAAGGENSQSNRWITFSHGVAFVLGFSVVFILLGVAASFAGGLLYDLRYWLAKIGGVIVVIFGLHMIGVFHIPFLAYDTRVQQAPDPKLGYLSSALMGVFFSAGWSPCVGPVLGTILTFAINGGSTSLGAILLTSYSAGLAIPFLIAALGVAASFAGGLLYDLRYWLAKIGGVIVVIFGLHMIGVFHIPFLAYDTRVQQAPDPKLGYLSSALMGVFFSAGWSPCVGPVLGTILTFAINGGSTSLGAILLTSYSAGRAIPFLIAALGVGWVTTILKKYSKVMRYVEIAMGVILVIVGVLLFTGIFELIAQNTQFFWVDFGI